MPVAAAAGVPLIDPITGKHWWVAGAAADLVIHGHLAEQRLAELLTQLVDRREPAHPLHITNPGGWLQHRLAQIAAAAGVNWGRRKSETQDQRR